MSETTLTPAQRLKALEREISKAETEVAIRQRQLKELKPQRTALEEECLEKYECEISALADTIEADEKKLVTLVESLEKKLAEAQGEDEEEVS